MSKAREVLKADIEKINDEITIEKIRIFVMGILAQQKIEHSCEDQESSSMPQC